MAFYILALQKIVDKPLSIFRTSDSVTEYNISANNLCRIYNGIIKIIVGKTAVNTQKVTTLRAPCISPTPIKNIYIYIYYQKL